MLLLAICDAQMLSCRTPKRGAPHRQCIVAVLLAAYRFLPLPLRKRDAAPKDDIPLKKPVQEHDTALLGLGLLGGLGLSLGVLLGGCSVSSSKTGGVVDLDLDVGDNLAIQRDDGRMVAGLLDGA